MIAVALSLLAISAEPVRLSGPDLAAYKVALSGTSHGPARPVLFRDLWERPAVYQGELVRVEGRLVRRFEASGSGEYSARTEMWIETPSRDLMCLVFPASPSDRAGLRPGASISFEGTSLGKIRYASGEGDRLAPLVVGARPPERLSATEAATWDQASGWVIGGIASAVVVLALARAYGSRPSRALPEVGPGVEFES